MGFLDRPYGGGGAGDDGGAYGPIHRHIGLPRPTPMVLVLIGINTLLAMLTIATGGKGSLLHFYLPLFSGRQALEVWRFVTFQFMHFDASHFLWNMVGLYFFGPPLERAWGRWRLLLFYLVCGVAGGLAFQALSQVLHYGNGATLMGASGGVLGCLMACAILFPGMIVLIFPIRWVAGFLFVLYLLSILWRDNPLGDAAHLGGMAAGGIWVLGARRGLKFPATRGLATRLRRGAWQRRMQRRAALQREVDRILEKIHQQGLSSLSAREKRMLKKATESQRDEDRRVRSL